MAQATGAIALRAGERQQLSASLDFPVPHNWTQEDAVIVVRLRNQDDDDVLAMMRLDGSAVKMMSSDEAKRFAAELFRDAMDAE